MSSTVLVTRAGAHRRLAALPGVMWLMRGGLIGFLVVAWQLLVDFGIANPFLVSSPAQVWSVLFNWFSSGTIWPHIFVTLKETLAGFAIGTALGIALGFVFALSRALSAIYLPFMVALNAMPRLVIGPLFVAIFGFGIANKIALVVAVVFFLVFFNVFNGVRETDAELIANARVFGATRWGLIRYVYLPASFTWLVSSLRTTVGLAFSAAIVGEYIGSNTGLGFLVIYGNGRFRSGEVYAAIAVAVVLVVLMDTLIRWGERRLIRWRPT